MGENPGEIREEIEATRDRMSQTADALAYKTDFRARVKAKATATKDSLVAKVRGTVPANRTQALDQARATKDLVIGKARVAAQDPRRAQQNVVHTAKRAAADVRHNPKPVLGVLGVLLALRSIRRRRKSAQPPVKTRTTRPTRTGRLHNTGR